MRACFLVISGSISLQGTSTKQSLCSLAPCLTCWPCHCSGSPEDFYFYMPWRYPGISPVTDSCGIAGGILPGQQKGIAGADYTETPLAKLGDRVPSQAMLPLRP